MDDSVIKAMSRWPDVPAVYGWLSLDARGRWCLQGSPVSHRGTVEYISRNYACTADGRWFFQNGPQRVFVDIDYTPWILFTDGDDRLVDHVGGPVTALRGAWIDEAGNLLLLGERGIGLVCDRDLAPLSEGLRDAHGAPCDEAALERLAASAANGARSGIHLAWAGARIPVGVVRRHEVPARFGFVPTPRATDHVP